MHNRALHDSLAAFVEEAAWQLAEEVSGGAEIPFELDATPTRGAPLYCYRPLTGRFIAAAHRRCSRGCRPTRPPPRGSRALPDLPAYLQPPRPPGARRRARAGRRRAAGVPRRGVGRRRPTSSSTRERFEAAYAELEDAAYAGCALSVVLTPVEGLVIESDEVRARRRPVARARDDAHRRARRRCPTTRTRPSRCSRWRPKRRPRARAAPAGACAACRPRCGCGTTPSRRSARPPRRAPTAAPGWRSRSPPACAAPRGTACSPPRRRTRCARSARSSPAARRARASWPGRCGASSSAASAPARSRR